MRTIFSFLMTSLDGYHATSEGDLDWHNVDQEFHDFAAFQMDQVDTILFGRKTYQGMAEFWRRACFAAAGRTGLKLTAVREFRSGNVLLTYQRA